MKQTTKLLLAAIVLLLIASCAPECPEKGVRQHVIDSMSKYLPKPKKEINSIHIIDSNLTGSLLVIEGDTIINTLYQ